MNNEKNEPAFPVADAGRVYHEGITIRDYFAAKAMTEMMNHIDCKNRPEHVAHHAYRYADAMLVERLKSSQG